MYCRIATVKIDIALYVASHMYTKLKYHNLQTNKRNYDDTMVVKYHSMIVITHIHYTLCYLF